MLKLYSFYWDYGRHGSVEGLFVADEKDIEKAMGREVYFGEILGKHSEVYGSLDSDDLKVISEDQEKIEWLIEILGYNVSGYNPLDYVNFESKEEEED